MASIHTYSMTTEQFTDTSNQVKEAFLNAMVKEGKITRSPWPIPAASKARCKALVQEVVAIANLQVLIFLTLLSKFSTKGPWVTQPEARTDFIYLISFSEKEGRVI